MKNKNYADSKKFLLDYANLKQNIIYNQKDFLNKVNFFKILSKPYLGIPFILPVNLKYFIYPKNNKYYFKIKKEIILKKLFLSKNNFYSPFLKYISFGDTYCSNIKIKKKYKKEIIKFSKENIKTIRKIKLLKKNNKIIGAFQSRNIPHLGHEALISKLLEKCDYVFINPVCGVKKKGDVTTEVLKKSYNFLIKKYYKNKLIFAPIYTSMFYAGPREALHHALLRQQLGFDYFIVGRDHAGTESNYKDDDAFKIINKYIKYFKIKILTTAGVFFCRKSKKIVILSATNYKKKENLQSISGTNFRKSIEQKKLFKFARHDLQRYIHSLKDKIFY